MTDRSPAAVQSNVAALQANTATTTAISPKASRSDHSESTDEVDSSSLRTVRSSTDLHRSYQLRSISDNGVEGNYSEVETAITRWGHPPAVEFGHGYTCTECVQDLIVPNEDGDVSGATTAPEDEITRLEL